MIFSNGSSRCFEPVISVAFDGPRLRIRGGDGLVVRTQAEYGPLVCGWKGHAANCRSSRCGNQGGQALNLIHGKRLKFEVIEPEHRGLGSHPARVWPDAPGIQRLRAGGFLIDRHVSAPARNAGTCSSNSPGNRAVVDGWLWPHSDRRRRRSGHAHVLPRTESQVPRSFKAGAGDRIVWTDHAGG